MPKKQRKSNKGKIIGGVLGAIAAVGILAFALIKFDFIELNILDGIFNKTKDLSKEVYYKEVSEENIKYNDGILYADNQVSLIANEGVKKRKIEKLAKQYDAEIVGYIEFTGDYQLEFSEEKSYDELNSIVSELEADPNVESASLYRVSQMTSSSQQGVTNTDGGTTSFYPNDPWDGSDWDKINPKGGNWGAEAIHVTEAWALKDEMDYVRMGLLDTNVDDKHEDLKFEKVWGSKDSSQDAEHGTHVAGIMGAKFDNEKGISGICPKSTLYASDIYGDNYVGNMALKCAFARLILSGVKVINCSFGDEEFTIAASLVDQNIITNEEAKKNIERSLEGHKEEFTNFLNKFVNDYDFLIVKSAGNANDDYYKVTNDIEKYHYGVKRSSDFSWGYKQCNNIDANYDAFSNITDENIKNRIIVVGSCKLDKFKSEGYSLSKFSNTGDRVDVVAPGENIYSTLPNDKYGSEKGTSMSAPHVTGLAGMIWGINKDLSAEQVKNIIVKTANIDVANTDKNMINARMAVALAKKIKGEGKNSLSEKGVFLCSIADANKYETADQNTLLEGVKVTLKDKAGNEIETLDSNGLGEVSFLVDSGIYDVFFEKEGYQSGKLENVEIKNGETVYKQVFMSKLSKITGKVVNKNGNSLEGATITFRNSKEDISIETNSDGSFSRNLKYGTYTLVISKKGYEDKEMTVEIDSENKDLGTIDLKKDTISNSYLDNSYLGEWYCGKGLYVSETNFNYISRVLNIKSISANSISFSLKVSLAYSLPEPNSSDRFEYSGFAENIIVTSVKNGKVEFTFEDYSHTPSIDGDVSHGTLIFKNDTIYYTSDSSGYLSGDNLEFTREMKKGFYRDKR